MGFFDRFNIQKQIREAAQRAQRAAQENVRRAQDAVRQKAQAEAQEKALRESECQAKIGVIAARISEKEAQIKMIQGEYLKSLLTVSERDTTISKLQNDIHNLIKEKKEISDKYDILLEIDNAHIGEIVSLTNEKNTALSNDKKKQIALYTAILTENLVLEKEMDKLKGEHTTDYRKVNYQSDQNSTLNGITNILWIFYYIIVFILLCIFIFIEKTMAISTKLLIIVVCCLYPYVINIIEMYLYRIYDYLYSIVNFNAYTNDY